MLNWDDLRYFLEVARTQRVSGAAARLGVEHTTVARRIRQLETNLKTVLFEKSRSTGFTLTQSGQELLAHVEKMESHWLNAQEGLTGLGESLSGHLRIAATEGFGSYVVTPLSLYFQDQYPGITVDVMPFQRFVNQTKREADIAITIERPQRGPYVYSKLCDYALKIYATRDYVQNHAPITSLDDLQSHRFITYVDELIISDQLRFAQDVIPSNKIVFRSNSVVAQLRACLQGKALAVLPCFMGETQPILQSVLSEQFTLKRSFWLYFHEDLKQLKRVEVFNKYLKTMLEKNKKLLEGNANILISH